MEWIALDLIKDADGNINGVIALDQETGNVSVFQAQTTVLATGGAGRIFRASTNAYINTGDGLGMAVRAGIPLQDMEFWQFHPTGVAGAGVLLTEGCRGEGAILRNKHGEPFMERYAPTLKDLAPRDFVSRSMDQEIKEGRGCGPNGDYIVMDMTHLGHAEIMKRLPSVFEISHSFANVDITKEPVPVVPTIHYMMGGIPTNIHGQVTVPVLDGHVDEQGLYTEGRIIKGLYAIGECACVSVHGANRLGTNSLLDLVVFGRAAGQHILDEFAKSDRGYKPLNPRVLDFTQSRLDKLQNSTEGYNAQEVADEIRNTMQAHAGVFRTQALMDEGVQKIMALAPKVEQIHLKDKSAVFNTARVEALEVANLYEVAKATMLSASLRHECRGAHSVLDYEKPEDDSHAPLGRNDHEWMKHTLWYSDGNRVIYKPVRKKPLTVDYCEPRVRTF